jgi:hypothetical protein
MKWANGSTKCGGYLLGPSLAAASLDGLFEQLALGFRTVSGSILRFSCPIVRSALPCGYGLHGDLDPILSQVSD